MTNTPNRHDLELNAEQAALVDLVVRGMLRGAPDETMSGLVGNGLAMVKGPIVMATPAGTVAASSLMRLDEDVAAEVLPLFDCFLTINRTLREVCCAWQTRADGSVNDHSEVGYDDDVRERLDNVHSLIGPVLRRLGSEQPRLAGYRAKLQSALDRFAGGDGSWLASPMLDSYHTVWMHLHQELLLMLGMSRADDEAREERLVQRQLA